MWLKTGDLTDDYIYNISETITQKALQDTSVKLNPTGSVLLAMYGATIGKVGILTEPATTNQACCACSEFRGIHNIFLFYLLISYREYFIHIGEGGAQPNISKEKIISTLIPLPPLFEQQRIVSTIEQYDNLINELEGNKEDLKQFITQTKSKILDLAIRGKLVPQDPNDELASVLLERIKSEQPASKKKTKNTGDNSHYAFEIPESWEWCYLEDIATNDLGKTLDKIKNQGKYYPYLRSVNVRWGEVILDDLKEMKFEDVEIYRYSIEKGDLLVCEGGEVGRCAVWDRESSILYQNAIHRVRFHCKIDSYLYMYFLWHYNDIHFLDNYSKGVTIKHLTKSSLNTIPFPLPPLSEQKRIIKKIEEIFASLDKIANSI